MKFIVIAMALVAVCASGCVNVDLGQASKDWSDVAKSYSDAFTSGQAGQPPQGGVGQPPQGQAPVSGP